MPALTVPTADPIVTSAAPACDACGHPLEDHDVIARRYCAATVAGALSRTCICARG